MIEENVESLRNVNLIRHMNVFDLRDYYGAEYYFGSLKWQTKYRNDTAVFIHLYYFDLLEYCYSYVKGVSNICDIFITTSNNDIKKCIEKKMQDDKISNCTVKLVENRGYDIASFIVHHCEMIKKYKYFCFVHDKKSSHLNSEESGRIWLQTLWENTLKSPEYIFQIIDCFEQHEQLGILAVPEPYWGEFVTIVGNSWCGLYKDVLALTKKLKLNCILNYEKPPLTIGMAFWAKTDALGPLLEYGFSLDDFPEMGVGKISYAIERILAYVAQSQGYYTGTVATMEYAARRILYMQNALSMSVGILQHRYCWNHLDKIIDVAKIYKKIDLAILNYSNAYIYGVGKTAFEFISRYPAIINQVNGFIVSDEKRGKNLFLEKEVFELSELSNLEDSVVIIAVQEKFIEEIRANLIRKGITDKQLIYIENLLKAID